MKRWIVLSLLFVPFLAAAAGFWDGNAALQRGDATFEGGLYAASNSFPPGTQITIQNQDTGKTVTATITGRIEGQSDILVLLSPKTAQALDLPQGTLGRVRVTVPPRAGSPSTAQPGDQTDSSDPDVNPAAAYGGPDTARTAAETATTAATAAGTAAETPTETPTETPSVTPVAETPTTTPDQPSATEETLPSPAPATETPVETTPSVTPEAPPPEQPLATPETTTASTPQAPASSDAEDAAILSEAQSRSPQKQVFQPPREDEKFVYKKPATVPQTPTTPTAGTPTITAVVGEPGVTPATPPTTDMALADVIAPEESRPEEIVSTAQAAPASVFAPAEVALASPDVVPEDQVVVAQEPRQTEVTGPAAVPPAARSAPKVAFLSPEAPAPVQAAQTTATTATTTQTTVATSTTNNGKPPATTPVQTAASLPKSGTSSYFLQLAAYGNEKLARELAAKLAPTYPALVLTPTNQGASIFKVVIGPLNRAESGTLLTWFRYRGFPDAFLKQE